MSYQGDTRTILIIGEGLNAWFPAAMLSKSLPPNMYRILVQDTGSNNTSNSSTIIARPNICRAHSILGIDDPMLAREAKARPVHASPVNLKGKEVFLPFGEYGVPYLGAAFNQHWLKANKAGKAGPLSDYNLALRLTSEGGFLGKPLEGMPFVDYGYQLSVMSYTTLLKNIALKANVTVIDEALNDIKTKDSVLIESVVFENSQIQPDLSLCFAGQDSANQETLKRLDICLNGYYVDTSSSIPGVGLHQLQNCVTRLLAYWPDGAFTQTEKSELRRIHLAEAQNVADMHTLLTQGPAAALAGSTLARKCRVYSSRGVIPTEDYEVCTKAEWLAAFSLSGLVPKQYDRIVDTVSIEHTVAFVNQILVKFDRLLQRPKSQRAM
jgi:hypothetical protein